MKQFGWQVVGCSMPAMQRQERHGHQEFIAAVTGQQMSWWLKIGGGDDLPHRLSDERSQRDMAAFPRVHRQRSCKLGERRSAAKNVKGNAVPPRSPTI